MRRLPVDEITPDTVLERDLYTDKSSVIPILYKGSVIKKVYLDRLRKNGVKELYEKDSATILKEKVSAAPRRRSRAYVPRPKPIVSKELKDNAINSLKDLFSSSGSSDVHASAQIIKHVDNVVDQLVSSIGSDRGTLVNISDLKSYDEYTYHHSLSVAVLSIAIGQYLGLEEKELSEIGKCAMMHDIGKRAIPIEIIHKPSRLSDDEFTIIKNHSAAGYDYLARENIGDKKIWAAVKGHHEKSDGTGYPDRLAGDNIPFWSRIISVADVYDALTSNRPYRTPMQPAEAIEYVMGSVGSAFDYEIVSAFVQKVELYPIGSYIELTDGSVAVVLSTIKSNMRPIVRILETEKIVDLYNDREYLSVVISRVVPAEEL